jgi:hypothetical protein
MPLLGPHEELLEACEALGFSVQREPSGALVKCADLTMAMVVADVLTPDTAAMERAEHAMPPVTPEQEQAFNKALWKLEREKIAVHEAGHAVAARVLGLNLCYVTICGGGETQFCIKDSVDNLTYDIDEAEKVERLQEAYAAGAAAERLVFRGYRPHGSCKDSRDVKDMEELKAQSQPGTLANPNVFAKFVAQAEQRLSSEEARAQIMAVARGLKEKGFLSRENVESLLGATYTPQGQE